ncbi:YqgE/AlgH family protein [Marinobacter lutaoensis]|jgi:putative transcriptional regulator|uniref:UPF0301 protein BTO32_16900 n=1 Tax=Marinobacter lutaoensis TaxID=135739 RepID=A0A1V2DNT4_9GAMM|nr:YqgE/AlgH family protein [Marinobacter lutaoensis]NVD35683.1 YqgE/AlgH family protein [Marinobacter lutaoensis]ONF42245.1 hypothetical protein BTO32_16900 [Marinobacter lutaoensis]|tara:strand:- start:60 stop:626 length:567 start_codon:yes stop_codon:yes gene_type:complete
MTATHANADSLRHHFLVASPWLADPRFHGGVIYLCDHSQEGALGLMVNHPMSLALGEILSQLEMPGADRAEPVYNGGPVQQERGFVLHVPGSFWQSTAPVADDVWLTTSRDILEAIGRGEGPSSFLVALGYSGWAAGQLEEELAGNAWLTCPASADLLFGTPPEKKYQAVLARLGIDLNQLTDTVGHA